MHKTLLLSCVFSLCTTCTTQLKAQVAKDTIRERINYRVYNPLKHIRFKENMLRANIDALNSPLSKSEVSIHGKDTVRKKRDYRTINSFMSTKLKSQKVHSHYWGIQMNHILRLLANDNNKGVILSNPYDLIYTFNHLKSGYGLGFGVGYKSNFNRTRVSGIPTVETAQGKTSFRIGPQKQQGLGTHWLVGAGIDILFSREKEITRNFIGGLVRETTKKNVGYGFGPRATLQFACGNRIRMGTEICWYFERFRKTSQEKFTGLPAEYSQSMITSTTTFILPVSVFISFGVW